MDKLSIDDIKGRKTSDTIFILGSGYSINKVSQQDWNVIKSHNSIAFNWFCKHRFEPTFFLIREQANLLFRVSHGETTDELVNCINKYKRTFGIICDVSSHTRKAYRYHKDKRIIIPSLIVKDDKSKKIRNLLNMNKNPERKGLIHGTCTLYNVLHLVRYLGYEKIVFVGIDLYDSRYFWLHKNESRHAVTKKRQNYKSKHSISRRVVKLVNQFKKTFRLEMYVTNPKSLLTKIIPHKPIEDFA